MVYQFRKLAFRIITKQFNWCDIRDPDNSGDVKFHCEGNGCECEDGDKSVVHYGELERTIRAYRYEV
jgi:hypothetical protein